MASPYYVTNNNTAQRGGLESGLPVVSQGLDSVRAYQFEIHFVPPKGLDLPDKLTLAAKQVSQIGMTSEDIEVNRVNDKLFYPGKVSPEELTVTFNNFYPINTSVANDLWKWFSTIYDPTTGQFYTNSSNLSDWKAQRATVFHLDAKGQPIMETRLFGVYPKSWKTAEFNYSTNEFHTIEMTFRYDFMEHVSNGAAVGSALNSTL